MKQLLIDDQETQINSPAKKNDTLKSSKNHHLMTENTSTNISLTENQIYSRNIIKQVLIANKFKSVHHDINRIHRETSLSAKPHEKKVNQFKFQSIPPHDKLYASCCGTMIKQVSEGFSQKKRVQGKEANSIRLKSVSTPRGKVSASGIVTYNFSSVNAQRSLGFNKINHQQKMLHEMKQVFKRKDCMQDRAKVILVRQSNKRYHKRLHTQKLILGNFQCATNDYLKDIFRQKIENEMIYNEKAKKLNYIQQFMGQQTLNYDEAHSIVSRIQDIHSEKIGEVQKKTIKSEINDEYEINHRKIPKKNKNVFVRFRTFVD